MSRAENPLTQPSWPLFFVVDDETGHRLLAIEALREAMPGCAVRECASGPALLSALDSFQRGEARQRGQRAVVLLDLYMPEGNGLAVIEELQRRPELRTVPVIMLTASRAHTVHAMAIERGAAFAATKPLTYTEYVQLMARVRRWTTAPVEEAGQVLVFAPAEPVDGAGLHDLECCGWGVRRFDKADDCLEAARQARPDCVVCDLDAPGGAELASRLGERGIPWLGLAMRPGEHGAGGARTVCVRARLRGELRCFLLRGYARAVPAIEAPSTKLPPLMDADFREMFVDTPTSDAIFTPAFEFAAASARFASTAMMDIAAMLGRPLFELFPENPDEPGATGPAFLRRSLERVVRSQQPDRIPLARYDVRSHGGLGPFQERWWHPSNMPVLAGGRLLYIIHRTVDVTRFVRLAAVPAAAQAAA